MRTSRYTDGRARHRPGGFRPNRGQLRPGSTERTEQICLGGRANSAQYSETARVGFNTVVAIVIGAIGAGAIVFAVFGERILGALGFNLS